MLEKAESAAGPEHAADLSQGALWVVDGAEHGHCYDGVEHFVVEWQLLGRRFDERDLATRVCRALSGASEHRLRRLDAHELVDLRVVREALAGPDADLEHASTRFGDELPPQLGAVLALPVRAERVVQRGEDSFANRHEGDTIAVRTRT